MPACPFWSVGTSGPSPDQGGGHVKAKSLAYSERRLGGALKRAGSAGMALISPPRSRFSELVACVGSATVKPCSENPWA